MPAPKMPRSRIERRAATRPRELRGRVAGDVRRAREDAGLSQRAVAGAAGVSDSTLAALERSAHDPSTEVLARVATALGMDLSVRLYPGTGPLIRDHLQAAMIEALLRILHPRWHPTPEVWVTRPVRGVIDLVLEPDDEDEPLIATEAQSELRRLEQQLRWSEAKAEALTEARGRKVSRLLLLRGTTRTHATVAEYARTIGAALPGRVTDAHAALTTRRPWPGPALIWCDVRGRQARVRPAPPRGITVGR